LLRHPAIKADTTLNAGGIADANVIYINAQYWGGDYYEDRGTVLYELMHSLTGLTEDDFARMFVTKQNSMMR